jgi:hypothetical protein
MARFLVLYRSSMSPREMMAKASAEEIQAGVNAWMGWARTVGPAVVELGAPLDAVRHLGARTEASAGDVVGYSLLDADSSAAAGDMLEAHPHLGVEGNSIDILELLAMPGS